MLSVPPTPSPDARPALDGESEGALLREERALDAARLASILRIGIGIWLAVGVSLVPIGLWIEPRPLWQLFLPHLAAALAMSAAYRLATGGLARDRDLHAALVLGFAVPALATALVSALYRGIVSPLGHGTLVLITAFAIGLPLPARRSAPWLLALTLSWPLTLLMLCAFDGALAAQLDDPRLRADFQETAISQLVGALLAGVGQSAQWHARRELLAERVRNRYRIAERLGAGGMGEVFRAFHPGLGRDVALKVLRHGHGDPASDAHLRERFVREVRRTAELVHPGIVRILDCGVDERGALFYTMELLHGRTLHELVMREGALPPARAAHLVLQAASAISEAHARGLVHRDVKPENLFVTSTGGDHDVVKVLDFGIAKSLAEGSTLTSDGMLVGTPRFMALEQAIGEPVTPRTDVYALGAVLYFALVGTPPIEEPTVFAVVAAHAAGTILPPSARDPSLPDELDAIVMRCLEGDPGARFADAGELARALAATGLPASWRPDESAAPREGPIAPGAASHARARSALADAPTKVEGG